ncbi:hypothetical protein DM01DRAFT_1020695 [Hesseltinella vesiculosa]|uniref:Uncharacterized protein n=1 Tax=Hesseltinella vesiculosa TaxID=101127 RepID=A0A1X2GLM1_9FUNG|nr:hypothetical protein DM01DRAFT_1020695 [Hesseltinella vesiculosa]
MIEWNPAREPPPTTGMATHFPNLTLHYGNVWDQPLHEHPVWIPPSLPATRVPAAPDNPPPQPHPAEHTASPSSPLLQYHLHHPHRLHNHHQHNEHQPESQYQQHSVADPTTPAEPLPAPPAPTFPWEHRSAPEPTRIWLEDQTQRTPHIKAQEHSTDDQNQEDTRPRYDVPVCDPPESQNASNDLPGGIPDSSSDHGSHTLDTVLTKVNPAPINTVSDQASDPPLELQPASKTPPATPTSQYAIDTISPALLSRSSSKLTLDEEHSPDDWSDRDLIPINLKSSSKLHLGSPMSPRSPFSMSRRNSMPSILATSRRGSVSSLRSWTNHGSPAFGPVSAGPVSATGAQPVTRPLFATTSMFASAYKQTPYTSAAATPTAERSFYFDDQPEEWTAEPLDIDDDDGLDANSVDEDNPVPQLSLLSLDYSLDLALREASNSAHHYGFQHQSHPSYMYRFPYPPYNHHRRDSSSASSVSSTSSSSIPNLPLTRSWSSHPHPQPQASTSSPLLSTTATRSYPGSGASSPGANTPTRSRRFARKASWDPAAALENLKRQTENIITSGPPSRHAIPLADIATPVSSLPHAHSPAPSVSPTTPTMHALRDNLTLEIAAAKDSYRQEQRMAHHIMMQPTMAIGTHLEVELDMSKSALLHRRHPAASTSAAAGNIAIHAPIASALSTFPDSPRATPSLTQDEHNDDLTTSEDADSPESVLKQVDGQLLPQNGQPANVVPEQDDLPLPPSEPSPQLLQHKEESDPQHRIEAPVTSMDPEAFVFPMLEQPELPAAGPSLGSPSTSSSSTFFFDPSAVAIAKQRLAELVSPLEQEDVEVTSPSSATLQCLSQYSFPSDALIYASPQLWPPHRQASVSSPSALGSYGVTSTPPSLSTKETAAQIPDIASSLTGDDPHPSNQTENTDPDEENSSNQQHVMVIDHVSLISSVSSMTSLPSAGTTDQEMDDQDDNDDDDNDSMMYLSAVDSTLVSESDASDWHTVGTATPIGLRSPLIFDAEIARRPALLGAMVQLLENDDADDEELSISSDHTATGLT